MLICASVHGTSSQASFPRESSNSTTTEENWRGLIHLEAGASICQRESNEKEGRYGQLWYTVPSVFAGVAGTSPSSSGVQGTTGYQLSNFNAQK